MEQHPSKYLLRSFCKVEQQSSIKHTFPAALGKKAFSQVLSFWEEAILLWMSESTFI